MTLRELERSLKAGGSAPVYVLFGDNQRMMDEALKRITAAVLPEQSADLDLHQYTAQTHAPADILQALRTVPFLSSKKLVIVRDAHLFKPPQLKQVLAACEKPSARCCLVVVLHADLRVKKERERIKTLSAYGEVIVCENPRGEKHVGEYITQELAQHGKKIAPDALSLLSAVLDEDAQAIAHEAEKLALYCGGRTTVTFADVGEVVSCGVRDTLFALIDAMAQGAADTALPLLKNLRDTGTHPLAVLKLLARRFRQIDTVRSMIAQGAGRHALHQALRPLPKDAVEALSREAERWPADRMGAVFDLLFEANTLVKSNRIDGESVLTNLTLRLSALRAQAFAAA